MLTIPLVTTSTTPTIDTSNGSDAASSNSGSSTDTAAIAGGTIGGIAGATLLAVATIVSWMKRRMRAQDSPVGAAEKPVPVELPLSEATQSMTEMPGSKIPNGPSISELDTRRERSELG